MTKKLNRSDLDAAAAKYKNWGKWGAEDEIGTCLLYTSPSPRDRQKYRMPSSA